MDVAKTNPTLDALIGLREKVQAVRDAIKGLGYTRPPAVAPELLDKVREAGGHVRAARDRVQQAEQAVAAQVAAIERMPFAATDAELKSESLKLRELRETLELLTHRAKSAAEHQNGAALGAKRAAEQGGEVRRQLALTILNEIGGAPLGKLPNGTLGCLMKALAEEVESLAGSYRHEVMDSIAPNIEHAIRESLQR